jgi:hypothetical protein
MKLRIAGLGLGMLVAADAANAATIVVYTDPMTLSRRTVVFDTPGPNRFFLCMAPPSEAGCTAVSVKQLRT